MDTLTQEDWQYIANSVQERFNRARPKRGEPPASRTFKEQEDRIMGFLLQKAYPIDKERNVRAT